MHEYGPLKDTMALLKPIHKSSMLIPYEQLLIQTFHQNGTLIPEQNFNKQSPLFMLATENSFINYLPTIALITLPAQTSPDLATLEPYLTT
jgi:hypothetical protein